MRDQRIPNLHPQSGLPESSFLDDVTGRVAPLRRLPLRKRGQAPCSDIRYPPSRVPLVLRHNRA
jgi:hypothetical protein